MAVLTSERGHIGTGVIGLERRLRAMARLAEGRELDPVERQRLAALLIARGNAYKAMAQRQGPMASTAASLMKLGITEMMFDAAMLRGDLAGADGHARRARRARHARGTRRPHRRRHQPGAAQHHRRATVEHGSVIRITPRRAGSIWSARNVGRVEALRAEGRMREPGEAAFAVRREDRTAIYSSELNLALDRPAEAALREDPAGWAYWEALPKGYRRLATYWVMSAKRPETRERRLARLVDACNRAERLPELTGRARAAGTA